MVAFSPSNDFAVARDDQGEPIIFALGNDSVFRVIVGKANPYSVHQHIGKTIFLVVGTAYRSQSKGRLLIFRPFKPSEINLADAKELASLVMPQSTPLPVAAERIMLGDLDSGSSYPTLVITYKKPSHITSLEDISRVNVSNDLGSWNLADDFILPTGASEVLDLKPATVLGTRGIFVLYEINNKRRVLFTAYTRKFDTSVDCPEGASRIATLVNSEGQDDLLILADGLYHVHASSLAQVNGRQTLLSKSESFNTLTDIEVWYATYGNSQSVSIFFGDLKGAICYLQLSSLDNPPDVQPTVIVPAGKGGFFKAFPGRLGNPGFVYRRGSDDSLILVEQKGPTRFDQIPWLVPNRTVSVGSGDKGRCFLPDSIDHNDKFVDMDQMHMRKDSHPSRYSIPQLTDEPTIYDQGAMGTCTTNAVAMAYRYELKRQGKEDFLISRLFLYYTGRLPDIPSGSGEELEYASYYRKIAQNPPSVPILSASGTNIRTVVRIRSYLGAPSERLWPYINTEPRKVGDENQFLSADAAARAPEAQCYTTAKKYISLKYLRAYMDVSCWKACIDAGHPIIFGFRIYPTSFNKTYETPYIAGIPTQTEDVKEKNSVGGHAVLAVGWDDSMKWGDEEEKGCFRVQNSWGEKCHDKGFFWMPYRFLDMDSPQEPDTKLVQDPWTLMGSHDEK